MDFGLTGKSALVNGAGQGIGFATALALAAEGCDVAISARTPSSIDAAADRIRAATTAKVVPIVGDIRSGEDCTAILEQALSEFGGLDVLVNNDGAPPLRRSAPLDDSGWQRALEQNLFSVIRMIRGTVDSMAERGGGSIVNVTALSVLEPTEEYGLSVTPWAAVLGLAKTLARELGPQAIRVNTVCPGRLDSERVRLVTAHQASKMKVEPAELVRRAQDAIPLGRFGRYDEVADTIAFLASPRASYISGTTIAIDGGARRSIV